MRTLGQAAGEVKSYGGETNCCHHNGVVSLVHLVAVLQLLSLDNYVLLCRYKPVAVNNGLYCIFNDTDV